MGFRARVRRGAADRLTLVTVLCATVVSFWAIDWLKRILGEHFLKLIVLGLGLLTVALVIFTASRLKASGIKPPSLGELRAAQKAAAQPEEAQAPAGDENKEKGGL